MSRRPDNITLQGDDTVTVQGSPLVATRYERPALNRRIVQMAEAEYARQHSQPIPTVRDRGGLSVGEVIMLMAEALTRYAPPHALVPECDRSGGSQ